MATEKRLIEVSPENVKSVLGKVPYYPDEIWKFTAMTERFPTVDAVEVVHSRFVRIADFGDGEGCFGHCEKCGTVHHSQSPVALKADYRWCRWCGAKMGGDGNG